MASVLIIAKNQMIGGLLGQLADLAGHAAQFGRESEAATESVRHSHPDVVMLDTAFGRASMDVIADAAADVGAPVVYFTAALPASELRRFALERGAKYFALPAGPKLLARVLASALTHARSGGVADASSPGLDAVTAAVAAVARARVLASRSAMISSESQILRAEHDAALANCRRSQAELREAVIAYTRELRAAGLPPDRTLEKVKAALRSDVNGFRLPEEVERDLDDAVEWCLQAYYAA
jgi:DNA-binding response OmpR family regulator